MLGFEVEQINKKKKKQYPKQNEGWRLQRPASEVGWVDQAGRRQRLEVREL